MKVDANIIFQDLILWPRPLNLRKRKKEKQSMEERATLKEMVRKLNEVLKTRVAPGPLNANPNIPQILYDIIANNDVYLNVLRDQNRPEFKTSCGQAQSVLEVN